MIQVQRGFLSIRLYKEHFRDLHFALKKNLELMMMSSNIIELFTEHDPVFKLSFSQEHVNLLQS